MDGFAGVYPEHKYAIVEAYQSHGRLVGMTGEQARGSRLQDGCSWNVVWVAHGLGGNMNASEGQTS